MDYDDNYTTEDNFTDEAEVRPRKTLLNMIRRRTQHQRPVTLEETEESDGILDQINF